MVRLKGKNGCLFFSDCGLKMRKNCSKPTGEKVEAGAV